MRGWGPGGIWLRPSGTDKQAVQLGCPRRCWADEVLKFRLPIGKLRACPEMA